MQIIHGIAESDLIDRLKEGDQTAFELLFHFYYPGLVMFAIQFIVDRNEAEEIVQEFFVRFWQKRQKYILGDSLKNYFFSSVKNKSLDFLKHKKIEEKYIEHLSGLSKEHLVFDPDLYIASELQEKIIEAIDLLPEKRKEIFIMSRLQGLSNDDIATTLNLSKRTVETQISNALKTLRIELKDYLGLLIFLGILHL